GCNPSKQARRGTGPKSEKEGRQRECSIAAVEATNGGSGGLSAMMTTVLDEGMTDAEGAEDDDNASPPWTLQDTGETRGKRDETGLRGDEVVHEKKSGRSLAFTASWPSCCLTSGITTDTTASPTSRVTTSRQPQGARG
ncbi:unnamed protein product, partial [Laminaria digitata]